MKILYVITRAEMGGAQTHVVDFLRGLREQHDVAVATGETGYLTETAEELGVPWHVIPDLLHPIRPIKDARALRQIIALLRRVQPDLVHAHTSKAGFLARAAARVTGTPCVFTAHTWCFAEGTSAKWKLIGLPAEQIASRWCSRIVNVSEANRDLALQNGVANSGTHVTIHNGVADTPLRANPGFEGAPRILMVARFAPQKAQSLLVEAVKGIDAPFELHFIGDGPTRPAVEKKVREAGLQNKVRFLGQRTDIAELMASSHIFALFSHWEGFPISTLEAMRAGLPMVVSDVGGNREAIDAHSGFVVPAGDVASFRDSLHALITNPELRARMGRAARLRYQREFTVDVMLEKTLTVYQEALRPPEMVLASTNVLSGTGSSS